MWDAKRKGTRNAGNIYTKKIALRVSDIYCLYIFYKKISVSFECVMELCDLVGVFVHFKTLSLVETLAM